jgi:hypothetical protein
MPLTREEALRQLDESPAIARRRATPPRVSDLAVSRFIFQLLGLAVFLVGCGILFAVVSGFKRPLRALGIATSLEMGILLVSIGAFLAWMNSAFAQAIPGALEPPASKPRALKPAAPAPQPLMNQCTICAEEILGDADVCANCDESR